MTAPGRPATVMAVTAACFLLVTLVSSCGSDTDTPIPDEAKRAGRGWETLKAANEDYYADMDRGMSRHPDQVFAALPFLKTPEQAVDTFVKGRNNWIVWTAGNDTLWNYLSGHTFGALDFLKTLSTHDTLGYGRNKGEYGRWRYFGLVNEPCFEAATGPDPTRFGLWLDRRRSGPDCPPDPFEDDKKYPGVVIGARGQNLNLPADKKQLGWPDPLPVGSYYGYATGVVGLRLFPNPDFDAAAAAKWDPDRFYNDPSYYANKDLVRPYRVGMSCGFCHVGPSPINPPVDPENPKWENLTSNPGSQYFWVDRIFFFDKKRAPGNFAFQLFHTNLPGTLDTSLVSSDNINNPRTMNAVYALSARLDQARRVGSEKLGGGSSNNKQFNDYPATDVLKDLFDKSTDTVLTPRVLKDGADSVGALGALNRVYLNIGMASDEWLRHFMPLIGPTQKHGPVTPIQIADLRNVSSFWRANEEQTPALAAFFLASAKPDYLKDAPGGAARLAASAPVMDRGKDVFAERCARCHSSKTPPLPDSVAGGTCAGGGNGPQYLDCWDKYWKHTWTPEFKDAMKAIVRAPDFLEGNFLSSERRIPVTLLETNACSPLATNALKGNIWDNFSSQSYKELPSVGPITVYSPIDGKEIRFEMPADGRGYTRPASLISLWSTAPYLLNNSVGTFNPDPSVEGRLASFDDSIRQMLWPERRQKDSLVPSLPGYIQRTTARSSLSLPVGYLPDKLQQLIGWKRYLPLMAPTDIEVGPIPAGTPVGLLANLALISEDRSLPARIDYQGKLIAVLTKLLADLKSVPAGATDEQARAVFHDVVPQLMEISKCPDYVVNRGHYFGTSMFKHEPGLSDQDKDALIAFLKTF